MLAGVLPLQHTFIRFVLKYVFVSLSSLGLADDSYVEEQYGKTYRWMLHRDTRSLEFTPKDNSEVTVLWKRHVERGMNSKYPPMERKMLKGIVDLHWGFLCCYYEQSYLTQEDSGLYTMRDKDKKLLRTVTIEVIGEDPSYAHFISFPFLDLTLWLSIFS